MNAASQTFGEFVRQARQVKRISQQELADQAGVSLATISRWERGQLNDPPNAEHVRSVCRILGLDPRRAAVILGYLAEDEIGDNRSHLPSDVEDILDMLQDPAIDDAERKALRSYLKVRLDLLRGQRKTG